MGAARKTILIVDDNDLNLRLFDDILQASGYGTAKATNGAGGIAAAEAQQPDLILMDIRLPDMTGIDAMKAIRARARGSATPIIAVTASTRKGDEQNLLDAGFDGFIAKPISIPEFLALVGSFLEKPDRNENAPD